MKRYPLLSVGLIVVVFMFTAQICSAAPVGKITATEGRVDVLKTGQNMVAPVVAGGPVDVGDIYRARSGSRAEIIFTNNNVMRIAPNTRVEIKEYMVEGDKSSAVMNLHRGRVQTIASQEFVKKAAAFAEGNKFEVHTPNAVAGIRGSNMITFYEKGWSGALFLAGYGYLCNGGGTCIPLTLGFMSFVSGPAGVPIQPVFVPEGARGAFEAGFLQAGFGGGSLENLSSLPPGPPGPVIQTYATGEPQSVTDPSNPPPATLVLEQELGVTLAELISGGAARNLEGVLWGNFLTDAFGAGGDLGPIVAVAQEEEEFCGNFTGSISEGAIAGTARILTSEYTEPVYTIWGGEIAGTSSKNGAFYGVAGGSWTSWDGNFVTIYVENGQAGFLAGVLSGTSTDGEGGGTFTGEGTIARNFVGTTDLTPAEGQTLLEALEEALANSMIESDFFDTRAWTIGTNDNAITFGPARNHTELMTLDLDEGDTTIGVMRHLLSGTDYVNESGATRVNGVMGVANRIDQVFMLGPTSLTDNLAGGLHMDATYSYMDPRRIGVVNASYAGTYGSGGDYRLSGVGALTAMPLAFVSSVSGGGGSAIYNIPTSGSGNLWHLAVVATDGSGVSTLYIVNTISDYATKQDPGIPTGDTSDWTRVGTISTPVYFRLTWGATPYDLDSHVYIYSSGSQLAHVFYSNEGSLTEFPYVYLDQDVTSGYGPELITITDLTTGDTYYYSVCNYSGDALITTSNAVVELMTSGFSALMGGTDSLWTAGTGTVPVAMMGQYFLPPATTAQTWSSQIYSYNYDAMTYTTYDGGAYDGFVGGYTIVDTMGGNVALLGVDPNGNGVIIKGTLAGDFYAGVNMFGMIGDLYPTYIGVDDVVTPADFHNAVVLTTTANDTPGTGAFSAGGTLQNITSAFLEKHIVTEGGVEPWGVWEAISSGEYTGTTSNTWTASQSFDEAFDGIYDISRAETIGSQWSDNKLVGKSAGYGADGTTGRTWIAVGNTLGVYNPGANSGTFQAISMGAWFETEKFLAMTGTSEGRSALQRLDIPAVQVGSANLSCHNCSVETPRNGFTALSMNDVKFFATQSGQSPTIWATTGVTGAYTDTPSPSPAGNAVALSGGGLNANFALKQWNTTNNKWTATVAGSGSLSGGSYTGAVEFKGAAAGSITPGSGGGTISGTGAGVAK